jgi:hypothetical protein
MVELNAIFSDYALMSAVAIFVLTAIAIFSLKFIKSRTGLPTEIIEEPIKEIQEEAKQELIKIVTETYRDPKTGKFVSKNKQKKLPADKNMKSATEESEDSEDKEASKRKSKASGGYIPIILLLLLPLFSCNPGFWQTGYKLFNDNVEITWKNDGTKQLQPIDSIIIKSNPIYWKEIDYGFVPDSAESESEIVKDGYRVWQLRTSSWRRFEVQRMDTVIYIYKK